jgi:hypothetical protein
VAVTALLELARWCRRRRGSACGAEPCQTSRMTDSSPPAPGERPTPGGTQRILDGAAERGASANAGGTESHDRAPTRTAAPPAGGAT